MCMDILVDVGKVLHISPCSVRTVDSHHYYVEVEYNTIGGN